MSRVRMPWPGSTSIASPAKRKNDPERILGCTHGKAPHGVPCLVVLGPRLGDEIVGSHAHNHGGDEQQATDEENRRQRRQPADEG